MPATDVVRTPDERFADLPDFPWDAHHVEVDLPGIDGAVRLARVDEGPRDAPPVVLLHGEPGFGRSDKPTDRGWFTYHHLAAALDIHLDAIGLDGPATLVVHDWGGLLGLPWAVDHPGAVSRLVITDTALYAPGGRPSDAWLAFRDYTSRQETFPAGFLVQGATTTTLPDEVLAAYEAPLHTPGAHAGALAMPAIVPTSDDAPGADEGWRANQALTDWDTPTLIVWGADDVVLPPKIGHRWAETIPGCVGITELDGAHHFLQEDAGDRLARHVADFVAG